MLLDKVLLPALNKELSAGLPLPTLGPLRLVDPHVSYDQGYVTLATAFEFAPNATADLQRAASLHGRLAE